MALNRNFFEIRELRNLTTELTLLKSLETKPLEAVEFYHHHISFEAPQKTCAHGQLVSIAGILHFQNIQLEFIATGKVSLCLDVGDHKYKYTIEMHRYDKKAWNDFKQAVEKTQQDVDRLFTSMRDLE
ncbi:MAG: hypothetical protein ACXWRE_09480 [Pseudobdellovibrionaceae bacterium]